MTSPAERTSRRVPAPIAASIAIVVLAGVGAVVYAISAMVNDATPESVLVFGVVGLVLAALCGSLAVGLRNGQRGAQWVVVGLAGLNLLGGFATLSNGGLTTIARIVAAALVGGLVLIPVSSRDWFGRK